MNARNDQLSLRGMTGGEAIVSALLANGVDTVFGLPGAQTYPLFDALHAARRHIRTIGTRHEQGCAYMAFGYSRSTGRPGVFTVVPGPGALNTMAAMCTAAGCCAPVLCITGQVPSRFIGQGRGHLHELPDQLGSLRSVFKWAQRIERPSDAHDVVNEAFVQMLTGRPGPVAVEMPWDMMAATEAVRPLSGARISPADAGIDGDLARAAEILRAAKAPMIMVGSGAQHAASEVRALARSLGAPVAAFRGGRGIMPEDDPLGVSSYAAFRLWDKTDVLIGIGSRLEMPYMRWASMMDCVDAQQFPQKLVRIDIDPNEMGRLRPHVGIVADARAGLQKLLELLENRPRPQLPFNRIAEAKAEAKLAISRVQPHIDYLAAIRKVLPRDGILVEELCQAGFTSYFGYPVFEPQTYISPGFQGTLGFGFQTALGVKVAHPKRPVVSITGDGGFMFGVQELATAAQYDIGVVIVLFNNQAFGNVVRDQQTHFGGRLIASELQNPDFLQLAFSFGIQGRRVSSPVDLEIALAKALAMPSPTLIEVKIDRATEQSPWPFIHPRQ